MSSKITNTLVLVVALGAASLAGCRNEPYCFNCVDGGRADAADERLRPDALPVDACEPTGDEVCDGLDNDCDGEVDEGFDTQTNPAHCGACNSRCELPHALPGCMDGQCVVRTCDVGYHDLDRNPANGCEYACTPTGDEVCDGLDNDCDGMVDEGIDTQSDALNCGRCGNVCRFDHAAASCVMGACVMGACVMGYYDANGSATDGCEYACDPSGPEVCDSRDNDCDGMVDEGTDTMTDPMNCGACGRVCTVPNGVAGCAGGTCTVARCNTGFADDPRSPGDDCNLACGDATGATGPEVCDNFDNDCNGLIDDGMLPGVGAACGMTDTGDCQRGRNVCDRGVLRCVGEIGPSTEICDGRDNDCDGAVDEAPLPGVGAGTRCGTNVGVCTFGTFACSGGAIVCTGGTGPSTETCNGLDDDCDGVVDDGVTVPSTFRCNQRGLSTDVGVCATTPRICSGRAGFQCQYPPTYRNLVDEALCDGLDNNCDGRVDEGCLRLGTERRLDQGTGNSIQPMLTGNASGLLGSVYLDRRNGNADIFFNRSTTNGATWLTDQRIDRNPTAGSNSVQPWLANSGSNFFAAWGDFRLDATQRALFANDSRDSGANWNAMDVNAAPGAADSFNIQVVADGLNVTVVWEALFSNRSRHIDVAVSRDGGRSWPTFLRVDHAPSTAVASLPSLAMGAPGEIYVAWRDNRNGSTDIYFNRSLDYGVTWLASDLRLDTDAAGTHVSDAPSVAADRSGNVFVAWSDIRSGTRSDIYMNVSTNRGASFAASDRRVDQDPLPHDSRNPIALAMGGLGVAVVWLDDRLGLTSVYAQRSDDGGVTWLSDDQRVQTNSPGTSEAQNLTAATSNGIVFVGWSDDRDPSASGPLDIYANYSLDGGRLYQPNDIRLDTAPAGRDAETPFVFSVGGIGHFVWVDRRSDGITGDIYYRSLGP